MISISNRKAGISGPNLAKFVFMNDEKEIESAMRQANINILMFYLMTNGINLNHCLFYDAAIKLLGEPRIRGRRRQLFEKFIGRMAAERFRGNLCDKREEVPWED